MFYQTNAFLDISVMHNCIKLKITLFWAMILYHLVDKV